MKGLYYVVCDSETFLFIGIIVYYGQLIDADKYYSNKIKKKNATRRTWTTAEEQCLINALKDIVLAG